MNRQEILKKIGGIIAELKDQHTYLNAAENGFNDLELELFLANAHFLTDHINILQKINHQPTVVSLPLAKPVLQLEEVPQKPIVPDYFAEQDLPKAEDPVEPDTPSAEIIEPSLEEVLPVKEAIILPETMPLEEADLQLQEVPVMPEALPQTKPEESPEADASFMGQNLATPDFWEEGFELNDAPAGHYTARPETVSLDTKPETASDFSISSGHGTKSSTEPAFLTLNDRIAAQNGLDQPKSKPDNQPKTVQDLQSIINLNDKLLFVKELFNGYNLAYAEAINILNRYNNFEQAENFLKQNYMQKNNWKDKPLTSEKFMDLLRRRFA